jgi:protein-S-isoprenylcysteine O-methyltransferase Ste14
MRRWLVPAAFLAAAAATGAHAWDVGLGALRHPDERHVLVAVYALLRTAVALAFAAFTLGRAEPHRRSRDPVAFAACAVAIGAVLAVGGPERTTPSGLIVAGDAIAVIGCLWLVAAVMALGRCFGVLPEARGLVVRGPYRLVRHPVYLGELIALAGLVVAAPTARNMLVLAIFLAAQLARTRFEEGALSAAFPEYEYYAARTGRLLPRLRSRAELRRAANDPAPGTPA